MADQFKLSGGYGTDSLDGEPSFAAMVNAPIDEQLQLDHKYLTDLTLTDDTPTALDFGGGVTNAHVVILKAVGGGAVRARFTTADGDQQAVPFDTYLILMCMAKPVTAIDLTRLPSTPTTVRVFLGEKA